MEHFPGNTAIHLKELIQSIVSNHNGITLDIRQTWETHKCVELKQDTLK